MTSSQPRTVAFVAALCALSWSAVVAAPAAKKSEAKNLVETPEIARRLEQLPSAHPRLFMPVNGESALRTKISADPVAKKLYAGVIAEADRLLGTEPVERVLIGRRLLDKSRTCLTRVMHFAMAWRMTGEQKYLDRARAELVAVSAFSDWNPKHFLDVAEMTMAVGIGYDWLYNALDEPTRAQLRAAILEKGLKASLTSNSWTRSKNNWNQVCNAGMAVGALAIAESEPKLAADIIARAINTVPVSMHEYVPDGAYPEGPSYWGYGTTFNVILISALQSTLGSDFGLTQQPGFLATADYYLHVTGPSGYYFNYADCGRGGSGIAPAMFWFAAQRKEPYLLWSEMAKVSAPETTRSSRSRDRTSPLMLLWMPGGMKAPTAPRELSWTGRGSNPVALHRSAWERNASFVAIKGGSPSVNHGHMDVGAFVMDADGVRWADDLGAQDYNSLESKGVDLWGKGQESGRWKVFRLGTSSHNVLMVDGQNQRVDGYAPIALAKTGRTVVDTSAVYQGQLAEARRGAALQPDRTVRVQDEFTALAKPANVRWAMVTLAAVSIDGPGRATLTQDGKRLNFRVLEPAGAELKIYPTDPPPSATDARNEGTRMIGFEVRVPAGKAQRLVVQLEPGSAKPAQTKIVPLADW